MEELREAARAYYYNGSRELNQAARDFFHALDLNSDGQVSVNEFVYFLQQSGYHWIPSNFFAELDSNHDGNLDFFEVLTLYYIIITNRGWCDGCQVLLKGLYFTCVLCFNDPNCSNTYDLCVSCYQQQRFSHHHNCFLDNCTLLQSKKVNGATNANLVFTPPTIIYHEVPARRNGWSRAFQTLQAGLNVGNLIGCSIM